MSMLAGFDIVTELSNAALVKLFKSQFKIDGVAANPPFELNLPVSSGGIIGNAHLIVSDITLDLNADDTVTINLPFDRTSVIITSPVAFTVCPLDGSITINAPILLTDSGAQKVLAVDFTSSPVTVTFSAASQNLITTQLGPLAAVFIQNATSGLSNFIHAMGLKKFDSVSFAVTPGSDGALSPTLTYERLEVHCLASVDRSTQALGLFGILINANDAMGDHTQIDASMVDGSHDVCVMFSPQVFDTFMFCPGVATALGVSPTSSLPTSCGTAGGVAVGGATLTSLTDAFGSGVITLGGSITKSGFCYTATGSFSATLTFSVIGGVITPSVSVGQPSVDIDIPWYCWLVVGVVLGVIGVIVVAIVDEVVEAVASSVAKSALAGALGKLGGVPAGGFGGAVFDSIAISPEGLGLCGVIPVQLPAPATTSIIVSGSVTTTHSTVLSSGTFHSDDCPVGDFPYTEYGRQQTASYQLAATLVALPVTMVCSLRSGTTSVPLTGTNGQVTLPVDALFPMPLPGGTTVTEQARIAYTISGNLIELTNVPADGDYQVDLDITATDCSGFVVTRSVPIEFNGDVVVLGGGYYAKHRLCIRAFLDKIERERYIPHKIVWPPVDYPAPEEVREFIRAVLAIGTDEAEQIANSTRLAHGTSYHRAIWARKSLGASLAATHGGTR